MSFHASASNIRVDEGHILRATLQNSNGETVDAEYDLNQVVGNNDGRFEWSGRDFQHSAEDVSFSIEGGASVPVLRARLRNVAGDFVDADLNLAERIGNNDGQFVFE